MVSTIDFGDTRVEKSDSSSLLFERLRNEGIEPGLLTRHIFEDVDFCEQYLDKVSFDEQYQILKNTTLFEKLLRKDSLLKAGGSSDTIFGKVVEAPETIKANGSVVQPVSGSLIEVEKVRSTGIDPAKVLMFRATTPSHVPKPEYYWTSDYFETKKGLYKEMGIAGKGKTVILVSSLDKVCEKGAIKDSNDDNGLSVRLIDLNFFDQSGAMGVIRVNV